MNESSWTLVAQAPLSQNLDGVVRELQRRGINHRIVTDEHRQSVWVENPEDIMFVDQLLRKAAPRRTGDPWMDGVSARPKRPGQSRAGAPLTARIVLLFRQFPVVMFSLLFSALGALIVEADNLQQLEVLMLFQKIVGFQAEPLSIALSRGEFWRLITPIFLHFGIVHLAFNCVWLWVFGSRIESLIGSWRFVGVVLVTGLAGNFLQYMLGPSWFGGMSGVVYGLMGYLWIRHAFAPHPATALPPVLIGFMLFFLFLGMVGTLDGIAGGGVANGAHVGGLVAGMALGWFSAQASRGRR